MARSHGNGRTLSSATAASARPVAARPRQRPARDSRRRKRDRRQHREHEDDDQAEPRRRAEKREQRDGAKQHGVESRGGPEGRPEREQPERAVHPHGFPIPALRGVPPRAQAHRDAGRAEDERQDPGEHHLADSPAQAPRHREHGAVRVRRRRQVARPRRRIPRARRRAIARSPRRAAARTYGRKNGRTTSERGRGGNRDGAPVARGAPQAAADGEKQHAVADHQSRRRSRSRHRPAPAPPARGRARYPRRGDGASARRCSISSASGMPPAISSWMWAV